MSNIINGEVKPIVIDSIYRMIIRRFGYYKISKLTGLDIDLVKNIAKGSKYKDRRNSFLDLKDLKREVRSRNNYYHDDITDYHFKKIEKLWLAGNGRRKIYAMTDYGHDMIKKVITRLVVKHKGDK